MSPRQNRDMEFLLDNQILVCKECGSSFWGSTVLDDDSLMRHCHGIGCKYTWHQSKDLDHAYEKVSKEVICIEN